jgi:hypothetical protein
MTEENETTKDETTTAADNQEAEGGAQPSAQGDGDSGVGEIRDADKQPEPVGSER